MRIEKAILWSAVERFGVQGLNFFIQLVLARLLSPNDYGLIGMIVVFIAISNVIIDSGFGAALVQKKKINKNDYSTVFVINVFLAILCYIILYASSSYISLFYSEPKLELIVKVLALNIIVNSLGVIPNSILLRSQKFDILAKIRFFSVLISGTFGIIMALNNYGVWSLVIQTILSSLTRILYLWYIKTWSPSFKFNLISFKSLYRYGNKLFISGLLSEIFENIYLVVIGKYFSGAKLGLYNQAKSLQLLPTVTLSLVVENVIFSKFSRIQDNIDLLKSKFSKALKLQIFLNFPIMIGLIVFAEPLIKIVLTEKWIEAVPYLQLLCLSGMLYPISVTNLNILKVIGRTDIYMKLTIFSRSLTILAIILSLEYDIIGLIIGRIAVSLVTTIITMYMSGNKINYSFVMQLKDISIILFLSIISLIIPYISLIYFKDINLFVLILLLIIVSIVYLFISNLFKVEPMIRAKQIFLNYNYRKHVS